MSTQQPITESETPPQKLDFLARWAGSLLLASLLFMLVAVLTLGSFGRGFAAGWGFVVAAVLSWIGWFVGRRQSERLAPDRYAKQRGLQAANALSYTLLFGVLLVFANYLAARHYSIFDLTSNRINSLSAQTRQALAQLPAPVTLTYVYAPRDRNGQPPPGATALLNSYASASDKVRVEFVNAVVDPLRLQTLALSAGRRVLEWGQPVIVAQMASAPTAKAPGASTQNAKAQRQEILVADEQNITSGLRRLLNPKARTLYFLTGHGEIDINQPILATARQALQAQNYTLRSTRLAEVKDKTQDGVPTDAAALIVVAPQTDPTANEAALLTRYAKRGRLVLLMSPTATPQPRWRTIVRALGVEMDTGFVIEPRTQTPQLVRGQLEDATRSPVLRGVSGDVLFSGAMPLGLTGAVGATPTVLFQSSPQSQAVTPPNRDTRPGPFVLAAAVEKAGPSDEKAARSVVVGNALFVTEQFFHVLGNSSFFVSSVNWAVGDDQAVAIPPKPPVVNRVEMNEPTARFIALLSVFVLPAAVLIIGGVVWWKRR
jgi:ABC-2 type transport system permease protein